MFQLFFHQKGGKTMAYNKILGKKTVTTEQIAQMLRKNLLKRKRQQAGRQGDANQNHTEKNSSVIR